MASAPLHEVADLVRAKNAGPFWMTLDVFLPDDDVYARVCASGVVDPQVIGELYRTPAEGVRIFRQPLLRAIKITFPRPAVQGSFTDRDMHSGQQHVLLAGVAVPDRLPGGPAR
ncbi:DUF4387 domain-containing protein [soil metagenome]